MTNYYWGPSDASVHFCEDKYTHLFWIAEYYNTLSSLCYILVGSAIRKRNIEISNGLILVGIGSILLHGTLRWYGQLIDEIAMLYTIVKGIEKYRPDKVKRYHLPIMIFLYLNFYQHFIFLASFFTLLNFYLCYITHNKIYITFSTLGSICWMSDKLLCKYVKHWYLHVWWHIFTSIGTYGIFPIDDVLTFDNSLLNETKL